MFKALSHSESKNFLKSHKHWVETEGTRIPSYKNSFLVNFMEKERFKIEMQKTCSSNVEVVRESYWPYKLYLRKPRAGGEYCGTHQAQPPHT